MRFHSRSQERKLKPSNELGDCDEIEHIPMHETFEIPIRAGEVIEKELFMLEH